MGASHSHKRQTGSVSSTSSTSSPIKRIKSLRRHKSIRDDSGYFSVKFKKTQIKIVNADSQELNTITGIIRLVLI